MRTSVRKNLLIKVESIKLFFCRSLFLDQIRCLFSGFNCSHVKIWLGEVNYTFFIHAAIHELARGGLSQCVSMLGCAADLNAAQCMHMKNRLREAARSGFGRSSPARVCL